MKNNTEHGPALWLKTLTIALMLALSGCGGGGSGGDSGPQPQPNLAPTAVQLVEVSSNAVGQLTASWMPATDDATASSNIRYQLHTSTQEGFAPAADTLRLESAGQLAGTVTSGLTAGQRNFVRLVALDEQGLATASAPLSVYVADTNAALVPGVSAAVLQAGQTVEVAPNSIRLAAGVSAPAPGTIVLSAEGKGFLRRVTGVTTSGDQTTILTAPAALSEVVTQGQFSSTVRMSAISPTTSNVQGSGAATLRVESTSDVSRRLTWAQSGLTYTAGVAGSRDGQKRPFAAQRRDRLAGARFIPGALESVYGDYGKVTAPKWVGSENSANGKVMISVATTSDKEPWPGNGAVGVCDITVADVTSEDPEVKEIQLTAAFLGILEPTLRETSTGRVKAAQRELTIAPIANLAVSKYPYKITLRARLQDVNDNCQPATSPFRKSAWRDEIETVITVFVTADDLPQGEQSTVDLNGSANAGFRVTSSVSTSFDPSVGFDVRLDERYAKVLIEASPMMEQTLTISADAAGSIDASAPVIQPRKFLKLFVTPGGLPVVVSGEFSLRLQVQGDVNGRLSATEKLTIGFDRMAYGIECNGLGNCQPIEERRPVVDLKVGGDGQATAALRVSLVPSLTLSLYEFSTGKVTIEPYAKADAGVEGKVEFEAGIDPEIQLPGLAFDADYRLTAARLAAGVNAYLFADLTPFDLAWDVWPRGATAANLSSHFAVRLAETTIAELPALAATVDMNSVNAADIRAIRIAASATNAPNPWKALFPSMPDSLIAWQRWTTPKIRAPLGVPAESYGFLNPDGAAEGEFWAFFTVPGTYLVRVGGFNVWGTWARQYTEVSVTVTDANGNGILDHVEARGASPAISVTLASCSPPIVGNPMTCTVAGSNLPASITFLATNCGPAPMAAVPGGTAELRQFVCTPVEAGLAVSVYFAVPGYSDPLPTIATKITSSFFVNLLGPQYSPSAGLDNEQDMATGIALANGNYLIAWNEYDYLAVPNYRGKVQILSREGAPISDSLTIFDGQLISNQSFRFAPTPDGGFVASWGYIPDSNGSAVFAVQRFDSSAAPVGAPISIGIETGWSVDWVRLWALDNDRFAVAFSEFKGIGPSQFRSKVAFFNSSLTAPLTITDLASSGESLAQPVVRSNGADEYIVTWAGVDYLGQNRSAFLNRMYVRRFSSTGLALGSATTVVEFPGAQITLSGYQEPEDHIAFFPDGGFVLTWHYSDSATFGENRLYARTFDAQAQPVSQTLQIGGSSITAYSSKVVALPNDSFAVAWEGYDLSQQEIGSRNFRIQQFDRAGGALWDSSVISPVGVVNRRIAPRYINMEVLPGRGLVLFGRAVDGLRAWPVSVESGIVGSSTLIHNDAYYPFMVLSGASQSLLLLSSYVDMQYGFYKLGTSAITIGTD